MGQSTRPRRPSLTQHLQRILHIDDLGKRHSSSSQSPGAGLTASPQQQQFTQKSVQKPQSYLHVKKSLTRETSCREPQASYTPEEPPANFDNCISPTWSRNSAVRNERRATLRLEAERVELEKKLMKLEQAESTKDLSSMRREPRRLTKKQPFGSSSRASSVSADESRGSRRISSIFSTSRRSSRSRSSSLNEDDRGTSRPQLFGPECATRTLSTTLPERLSTAISKELAVQNNPLLENHTSSLRSQKLSHSEVAMTVDQGTESNRHFDNSEAGTSHAQGLKRLRQEPMQQVAPITMSISDVRQVSDSSELDRSSFAAALNLRKRVSGKTQSHGRLSQSTPSQSTIAQKESRRELSATGPSRKTSASVTPLNTNHLGIRKPLIAFQLGPSVNVPIRTPRGKPQGRHKRFISSPLAGFPTTSNTTFQSLDAVPNERASASPDGMCHTEPSAFSKRTASCNTNPPRPMTSLRLSNGDGREDRHFPISPLDLTHVAKENPRTSLPNSSGLSDHSLKPYSSTAISNTKPKGHLALNQGLQRALVSVKPHDYGSPSNALEIHSQSRTVKSGSQDGGLTAAQTRLEGENTSIHTFNTDFCGRGEPSSPIGGSTSALGHKVGRSTVSLSASLSQDPESEEYNTADEAASTASELQSEESVPVKQLNTASVPASLSTFANKGSSSRLHYSPPAVHPNTPALWTEQFGGNPKQLRRGQRVAKLFVICCHCEFWHDMPSEMYAKLDSPAIPSVPTSHSPASLVGISDLNDQASSKAQELESMYDYLAKVILLGPSGAGKSCVLHRFVKKEWRVLSSQTIGVEFSSRIVKLGIGPRRTRIKLQLWDTAGTERFRSVSRSYYRGAAGAILIYDVSSHTSFASLPTFLMDARALASPNLTVLLAGNKMDLTSDISLHGDTTEDATRPPPTPSSTSSKQSAIAFGSGGGSVRSTSHLATGTRMTATCAPHGREVYFEESSRWAAKSNIPVAVEVSALTGEGVEELFNRLARIILTKIELGEIDPDDPQSGIQYGDGGLYGHGTSDGSSIRSRMTLDNAVQLHNRNPTSVSRWKSGMREWEDVFRLSGSYNKNGEGCC
ncbi:hypothetical protein ABOM_008090 [Aspergillus bombycis]|uniref:Ras family GTPase (Rab4b) n=1 Tax=Aspergillus bombycis TaxID=109264 RepID=A0A1F7ZUT2_9EURO|nr:hypothetical protein ABOM_008090 [Aspergillus bombycis]OGM43233.1 hypothetical protein ABOM_008090 [Aspergillus bombycis]